MSSAPPINVLILCTGNSARSILGEALFNHLGQGRIRAFSAGSRPSGTVNPIALETLEKHGVPLPSEARSKSWDEFALPGAPEMDFVLTVCDQAAGEQCPFWPGKPMSAHWGVADPAGVEGTEDQKRRAFKDTAATLQKRIELFTALPGATLDRMSLKSALDDIGKIV